MYRAVVVLGVALLAGFPGPAQSPSYELSADRLEIYSLALRDVVRSFAGPTTNLQAALALDPYIRRTPDNPRLSEPSTQALMRAAQLRQVCEPWGGDACRGTVRGIVIHLSEIAFPAPDSAQVVLMTTRARSEFDNTVLIPDPRYYAYTLSRKAGQWKVTSARRQVRIATG